MRIGPGPGRPGRRGRHRHRAGLALDVGVGHLGSQPRLSRRRFQISREVGPDRARPHRAAVAHGADAVERAGGERAPVTTAGNLGEDLVGHSPIAPPRVETELVAEAPGERILVDAAVLFQSLDHRDTHDRIVREGPGRVRQPAMREPREQRARINEAGLSEGIAHREAVQRAQRSRERGRAISIHHGISIAILAPALARISRCRSYPRRWARAAGARRSAPRPPSVRGGRRRRRHGRERRRGRRWPGCGAWRGRPARRPARA